MSGGEAFIVGFVTGAVVSNIVIFAALACMHTNRQPPKPPEEHDSVLG
jgi:hypothetical protein